jgi:integrase
VLAAAWQAANDDGHPRALRDLALVELVAGVGLRPADARLLTVTDVLMDTEGSPHGVALADGDVPLAFSGSVALAEWLRAREDLVPAGRILLVALEDDVVRPAGRRLDVPMSRAATGRALAAAATAAGVALDVAAADPDLTVLARSPAAWCEDCGSRWYSRAMVEGLQTLAACPRCGGPLHASLEHAEAGRERSSRAGRAPARVLGAPRPPRR